MNTFTDFSEKKVEKWNTCQCIKHTKYFSTSCDGINITITNSGTNYTSKEKCISKYLATQNQDSDRSIQVSKTCKILGKMHWSFLPINRGNPQRVDHFHQRENQSLRLLDVFYVCSFLWFQRFFIHFSSRRWPWENSILSRKFLIMPLVFHQFRSFDWKLRYLMLTYFLLGIKWSGFSIWCLNRVPSSFCNQLKTRSEQNFVTHSFLEHL